MAEFLETKALLAVMSDDDEDVKAALREFLDGELRRFEKQLEVLGAEIEEERERRKIGKPCGYLLGGSPEHPGPWPCVRIYPHRGEWHLAEYQRS